jgi:hypothetical protein
MLSRLTFAALFLAVAASGAWGREAMLGDAFVSMPPPVGFCELTPRYEFDGRTVAVASAYLEGAGVRLLVMSADCNQLAEAREGRRRQLDDIAQYRVEIANMKTPAVFSTARWCSIQRIQSKSPIGTDINARLANTIEKIKVNEGGSIGVIAEDKDACYTATLHKVWTETGTEKVLIGLQAATVINNREIGIHRYAVYRNPDTINAMLLKLKDNVAALIAANP